MDSSAIASRGLARPAHAERVASLGRLLPIAAPVTLLGLALAAWWKALIQPDTWVGLVTGREVAHHFLPSIERLTLIAQGRHWVDQQWLGQLTLYGIERAGGVGVVVAVGIACLLTAFALTAFSAQERGGSPPALLFWLIAGPLTTRILADFSDLPLDAVTGVLQRLARPDVRILRRVEAAAGAADDGARYEIDHDTLGEPILAWRSAYRE